MYANCSHFLLIELLGCIEVSSLSESVNVCLRAQKAALASRQQKLATLEREWEQCRRELWRLDQLCQENNNISDRLKVLTYLEAATRHHQPRGASDAGAFSPSF